MKIALVVVGKTDAVYFIEALNEYKKRLQHYISFEMVEIPDVKNVKNLTAPQQKEKEAEPILKSLQPGDYIVLLDEKGKQLEFEQVAMIVREVEGEKNLFAILKPISKIDGIADNEAIVFRVDETEEGSTALVIEQDEEIAIAVFNDYYDLLEEELKKKKD